MYYTYYTVSYLLGACSYTLIDPPTVPDHVTSYDHWACAQTSHTLPCGNAVGQCNSVRSNLYCWTSQHDANVVREHQGIVKNVTGFPKASQHLLKRQGKKLKRHGAVTLGRFGGNPAYYLCFFGTIIGTCVLDTGAYYTPRNTVYKIICCH